jgi:hypothetical protein
LRVGDTVARIGADEFVVLQVGISRLDEARLLGHRIVRTLSAPYVINGNEVRIGVTPASQPRPWRLTPACKILALRKSRRPLQGISCQPSAEATRCKEKSPVVSRRAEREEPVSS